MWLMQGTAGKASKMTCHEPNTCVYAVSLKKKKRIPIMSVV